MKVLQVNGYETPGSRFNGLSITKLLKKYDIDSTHLIWQKDTMNPEVLTFEGKTSKFINKLIRVIENVTSLQSVLYPHARQMLNMPAFKEADLIHLHIIHSGYFSIGDLPKITSLKPTVWTLHDPWALTGHCVHPFDCKRWMVGCGSCPDLKIPFSLRRDTTRFLFNYKLQAYQKSNFDIIVASNWMKEMVEASPLFKNVRIHHVPFGIDLSFFSPLANKRARKRFNISENGLVICFRADIGSYKGLLNIIQALEYIKAQQPIYLLTVGHTNCLPKTLNKSFQIIELGWIKNDVFLRDTLAAADIFLMPSLAEAFGMMAIEAMACAKPVIIFDGTSLPQITFAPEVGMVVPRNNNEALGKAIQHLIDNPEERLNRGKKGREIAERHYNINDYAKNLAEIYKMMISNK